MHLLVITFIAWILAFISYQTREDTARRRREFLTWCVNHPWVFTIQTLFIGLILVTIGLIYMRTASLKAFSIAAILLGIGLLLFHSQIRNYYLTSCQKPVANNRSYYLTSYIQTGMAFCMGLLTLCLFLAGVR